MRPQLTLSIIGVIAVLSLIISPLIGLDKFSSEEIRNQILIDIRVPRILLAFIAGCGLSLCGMVFQAMFRNPLATPFTLGVASGASLGAAISVTLGLSFSLLGIDSMTISAFVGALAAISFVYTISQFRYEFSGDTLLLTGVACSFIFSSLILFTQYLSDMNDSFRIIRWLMGGLNVTGYQQLLQLLPIVAICTAVIIWFSRELNLLLAGDELAHSRGVNVKRVRYWLFFSTSLCVGAVVALCGPIGFVGMMVPHICRLLVGDDHVWLTPTSLLFGGSFLVICDTISRLIMAPAELPVGILTTLLGGPFFLWLLIKSHRH